MAKLIKDTRSVREQLDINDALRLAVQDERFAASFIQNPSKYASAFNLSEIEVQAIDDAVGDISAPGFQYE